MWFFAAPLTCLLPERPFSVIVAFVMKTMASLRRHWWNCLKTDPRSRYARQVAGQACLFQNNQIAGRINGIRFAAGFTLVILLSGCATHKPAVSSKQAAYPITNGLHLKFHAATLVPDAMPAEYSYEPAKGKRGSAKEALTDAAEFGLGGPALAVIIPGAMFVSSTQTAERWEQVAFITGVGVVAGTVIGVGAFVAGPAVAAHGIIQSLQTVSPQELAERETDLRKAFKQVASQEQFHHFLLTSAQEKSPDRLIAIDVDPQPAVLPRQADAVLEARIEELRLERVGNTEGSYCLWITAHARLVRKLDGDLIYEQSVKFRSGRALFLDWTDAGALESVTQTGYRALADYFTSLIL